MAIFPGEPGLAGDPGLATTKRQWYGMVWYGIVEFNVPLDTV